MNIELNEGFAMRPTLVVLLLLALSAFFGFVEIVQADDGMIVDECQEVQVEMEDMRAQHLAQRLEAAACVTVRRFRKLFAARIGKVRIRILGSMERWRQETGRAWYIVASLRDDEVLTQPASSLYRLQDPTKPVIHEIAHLFIRSVSTRGCPRWLDEGLAQWLSGDRKTMSGAFCMRDLVFLENRLNEPDKNRISRKKDYDQSLGLVQRLVDNFGYRILISSLPQIAASNDLLSVVVKGQKIADVMMIDSSCVRSNL